MVIFNTWSCSLHMCSRIKLRVITCSTSSLCYTAGEACINTPASFQELLLTHILSHFLSFPKMIQPLSASQSIFCESPWPTLSLFTSTTDFLPILDPGRCLWRAQLIGLSVKIRLFIQAFNYRPSVQSDIDTFVSRRDLRKEFQICLIHIWISSFRRFPGAVERALTTK